MIETKEVLTNILHYAVYENSLKLEYGNELEKIKASAVYYGVNLGSAKKTLDNGKILYNSIPTSSPKVGLNIQIYWDFYNNEKTEFEKVCLLGFLGVKSIIGKDIYKNITNLYWLARMDGKTLTIKDIEELSDSLKPYTSRHQLTKIKKELYDKWGLIYYSYHMKGWYASFKLDLDKVVFEAEKKRKSLIEKKRTNDFK
jgi:hypothetical protein